MGNIIFPFRDEKPKKRMIDRKYLGYGHWLIYYSDGTKELRFTKTPEAWALFYKAENWTDDGFPIWRNET